MSKRSRATVHSAPGRPRRSSDPSIPPEVTAVVSQLHLIEAAIGNNNAGDVQTILRAIQPDNFDNDHRRSVHDICQRRLDELREDLRGETHAASVAANLETCPAFRTELRDYLAVDATPPGRLPVYRISTQEMEEDLRRDKRLGFRRNTTPHDASYN